MSLLNIVRWEKVSLFIILMGRLNLHETLLERGQQWIQNYG